MFCCCIWFKGFYVTNVEGFIVPKTAETALFDMRHGNEGLEEVDKVDYHLELKCVPHRTYQQIMLPFRDTHVTRFLSSQHYILLYFLAHDFIIMVQVYVLSYA